MDNAVDVIVLLFFIVSLLSGLFKKKTKGKRPATTYKTESSDSDDHISIPDIFGGGREKPVPQPIETHYSEDYYEPQPAVDEQVNSEENPEDILKKLQYVPAAKKKISDAMDIGSTLLQIDTGVGRNAKLLELKSLLHDTNTIRNYFLVSEILGKPKALRR